MAARASEMLGRGGLLRQAAAATAGALCGRRGFCSPPLGNSACARLPLSTTAQGQSGEGFCLGASVSPSASAGHLLLRTSRPRFGSLEDYYVMGEVATCIQSPMKYYGWFAWGFLMVGEKSSSGVGLANTPLAFASERGRLFACLCVCLFRSSCRWVRFCTLTTTSQEECFPSQAATLSCSTTKSSERHFFQAHRSFCQWRSFGWFCARLSS